MGGTHTWALAACTTLLLSACAGRPLSDVKAGEGFAHQSFGAIWDDPGRCERAVLAGRRRPREPGKVRIGSWNIKWFPDGRPGTRPNIHGGTDLSWLACAITYLDVDVLTLQEFKLTEAGTEALDTLGKELRRYSGASWLWEFDTCREPTRQHVGVLYRLDRVEVVAPRSHGDIVPMGARLEGKPADCPGRLRPAFGAYVRSKRGGADFHILSIHLDSGREHRDFNNRQAAWDLFEDLRDARIKLVKDRDIVVAGDFNMMGIDDGPPSNSPEEQALVRERLAALTPAWSMPKAKEPCSHYYKGKASLLDQVVVTGDMAEAAGSDLLAASFCRRARCKPMDNKQLPAVRYLSDHCPVLLDIDDRDLDTLDEGED